ncbi:hypothetical protein CCAN2_2040056 [Capnocytophaga canimorsus]|nr:hypothetical protein CCAN2_2040056 [Capnocytophaga canimorsus]
MLVIYKSNSFILTNKRGMNKLIDLKRLEIELKKRLELPYSWGRKQSNDLGYTDQLLYTIVVLFRI